MMKKERLDVLLVQKKLIDTREKAKRLIMAGKVFSENERLDKPGTKYPIDLPLTIKGVMPYVGRGGYKMEKALESFNLNIKNKIGVDIGSSTGGFTDCALQNHAKHIYAIDVGFNQLDWKLRSDERVTVMEKTNFRYVEKERFNQGIPEFAMIDVSFISLKHILPKLSEILVDNGDVIALIKPQFEAKKEEVGKKGVIRDSKIHLKVIERVIKTIKDNGFQLLDLDYSPITGGEGNIEFLAHLKLSSEPSNEISVINIVKRAHEEFK